MKTFAKLATAIVVCGATFVAPAYLFKPIQRAFFWKPRVQQIADDKMAAIGKADYELVGCYQKGQTVFTAVYSSPSERIDVWVRGDQVAFVQEHMPPCLHR